MTRQKGSTPLFLLILILLTVIIGGAYYLGTQKGKVTDSSVNTYTQTPQPTQALNNLSSDRFLELLKNHCLGQEANISMSGKIKLSDIPLSLDTTKLGIKNTEARCDSTSGKYIFIPVNAEFSTYMTEFITISNINSDYCCHGPSAIKAAGKLIKSSDVNIYIHTGTWQEGPNTGYLPIVIRGVKKVNYLGEELTVVIDRILIGSSDTDLQKIEDKYQIIDPNFDNGKKVSTPETVDKLLMDNFFSNLSDSSKVKKLESDLQSITLRN